MRCVVQRVSEAHVTVSGERVGAIEKGLCVLVGVSAADTSAVVRWCAEKVVGLRVFPDDSGRMNRDVRAAAGGILLVSQFTLYGSVNRGRRPSFDRAAESHVAEPIFEELVRTIRSTGIVVATGRFGADMQLSLVNDGPVTLIIERETTETV